MNSKKRIRKTFYKSNAFLLLRGRRLKKGYLVKSGDYLKKKDEEW